ncbi:MAG: hypothetical protein WD512_18990 [Candidatus Paceibacterota bacterium]
MDEITRIWEEHVAQNPIENILLEINLGTKIGPNCVSYELTGSKFNEILADLALLKIWSEWRSGCSTKYFLNDMVMIVDEGGHARVSINKTIYQKYLQTSDNVEIDEKLSGSRYLVGLPHLTDIRIHKDDIKMIKGLQDEFSDKADREEKVERTHSNLHIKCCRKIPLSIVQFPPYDAYHAIERIAYRYYRNANISVNFIISRPRDCLRIFDELLVNWQNSRFMIKIVVMKPGPDLEAILKYFGHQTS